MNREDKKYRGTQCLNCETQLDVSEKFCHACGQLNSTKKLTIRDFIEEFFANFYAYDSRLRNSIVSIFTKPGVLAREFNEGKRHTYANPFRLFLSVSIILFITFNLTEGDYDSSNKANEELTKEQVKEKRKQDSIVIEKLATGETKKNLFKKLRNNEIKYSLDSIYTKKQLNTISLGYEYTLASFRNFHKKYPEKTTEQALKELGFENKLAFRILYKKSKALKSNEIGKEIGTYFYEKLPFLIFLSLPILTLMFWIVFYSKRMNYTEHLVFSYTYFTFFFISIIIFNFIGVISETLFETTTFIYFLFLLPFYFYKSLRNFYQQSRWITILKFILLNPLFFLFLVICALVMMFLGILLF